MGYHENELWGVDSVKFYSAVKLSQIAVPEERLDVDGNKTLTPSELDSVRSDFDKDFVPIGRPQKSEIVAMKWECSRANETSLPHLDWNFWKPPQENGVVPV